MKLKIYDGCHIFLGRSKYYMKESSALCKFYDKIRLLLIEHGGEGYSKFPQIDFLKDDIKILKKIESIASLNDRLKFGFLHYYLFEKI